jgi:hypothetical protein
MWDCVLATKPPSVVAKSVSCVSVDSNRVPPTVKKIVPTSSTRSELSNDSDVDFPVFGALRLVSVGVAVLTV